MNTYQNCDLVCISIDIFPTALALSFQGSQRKRTYVGWVNNLGDILIGGIDHESNKLLPEVTLRKRLNKDDHANPALLILQVMISHSGFFLCFSFDS